MMEINQYGTTIQYTANENRMFTPETKEQSQLLSDAFQSNRESHSYSVLTFYFLIIVLSVILVGYLLSYFFLKTFYVVNRLLLLWCIGVIYYFYQSYTLHNIAIMFNERMLQEVPNSVVL